MLRNAAFNVTEHHEDGADNQQQEVSTNASRTLTSTNSEAVVSSTGADGVVTSTISDTDDADSHSLRLKAGSAVAEIADAARYTA